jgi:hypothetical protein
MLPKTKEIKMFKSRIHIAAFCLTIAFACLLPAGTAGQVAGGLEDPKDPDNGPIQVGYAIVTPTSANTSGLVVFETFGHKQGNETSQAGVLPSEMTTSAMLFVSTSGRLSRNLGVAIANPGSTDAILTLTLRDDDGVALGTKTLTVVSRKQVAQFVTEMFADQSSVPKDLDGTLFITSNNPVGIVGLRFRGSNSSTLPSTNLSAPLAVPVRETGVGGTAAALLAHFATGGGWASEIVIANSGTAALTVRVDLYKQDGTSLIAGLNGESKSSFTGILIPAGGVFILSPKNAGGDSDF